MGTGNMAHNFAMAVSGASHSIIHGVGSRTLQSASDFAAKFNVPNAYPSYRDLVEECELDAVYIATPHVLHEENMLSCIEAGLPVLCEKPFTLNAAQAENVINTARQRGVFVMEAMWTRFLPAVEKCRQILEEDTIGDVQLLLAGGAFMPESDSGHYLFNLELGGGVLLDAGVYLVSMASLVLGKPTQIKALVEIGDGGIDEHDAILLQHDNGALASLYVSLRAQVRPDVRIIGSKGHIHLHPPVFAPPALALELYTGESELLELPYEGNGYQYEIDEVWHCLQNGLVESKFMPLDETLQIMHTMDETRRQANLVYPGEYQVQQET